MTDWPEDATVRRAGDPLSTQVDGEAVLLDLESDTYFGIEGSGVLLWERLADEPTVAELVDATVAEYGIDRERAAADVRAFLADLAEHGLAERVEDA